MYPIYKGTCSVLLNSGCIEIFEKAKTRADTDSISGRRANRRKPKGREIRLSRGSLRGIKSQ